MCVHTYIHTYIRKVYNVPFGAFHLPAATPRCLAAAAVATVAAVAPVAAVVLRRPGVPFCFLKVINIVCIVVMLEKFEESTIPPPPSLARAKYSRYTKRC